MRVMDLVYQCLSQIQVVFRRVRDLHRRVKEREAGNRYIGGHNAKGHMRAWLWLHVR